MKQLKSAQDAIEQIGWHPSLTKNIEKVLTNSDFWIALGKARGWDDFLFAEKTIPAQDVRSVVGGKVVVKHWPEHMRKVKISKPRNAKHWAYQWFETRFSNGDEEALWRSLP